MPFYFLAMLLLSGAAFIHSKSVAPELRPSSRLADRGWSLIGKLAFFAWVALVIWGALRLHWSQPLAAILGSLALNAFIGGMGPRPFWPGLSMLFGVAGLTVAGWTVLR